MRIEALIFDIGNVLVPFDWQPFRSRLHVNCKNLTVEAERKFRDLMLRFEVGEMTGEMFTRLALRTIGFQGDEREFVSMWNGIFTSNPPMERAILSLKRQFPLFLLSNTSDLHLAHLMEKCQVLGHFLDGVYSFRAKFAKPDVRIFETAIKQFGVKPESTVYIDDLAINISSAAELGFRVIHYDLTKHAEFERHLTELGISVD